MSNIIDKMYDDLKAKGYLSKDRDTFNKFFFAPGETGYQNRKKLYDDLHSKGYLQSSSYEDFAQRIGLHSVRPSQTASRQQNVAQQANNRAAAHAAAAKSAPTQPTKGGWRPNAEQMAGYQRFTDGVLRTVKNGDDVMNRVNRQVARATRPNQQKVNLGFNNKHSLLGGGSQVQHEGKKFDAAKGDFVDQYSTEAGNVYDNTYEADAEQYNINRNKRDADTLDAVADIERQIREQEELLEKTRKASRNVEAPDNLWDAIRYTMSHADGPRLDQEDIDEEAIKANITNLQNKRSLLLHGTSIGQKVGKSIGDQLAEVNRMIGDDIDNYYKRHPNGGPTLVSHDYHATGQYQINPYLDVAARSLEDAQEMFNEAGKSVGESGLTGFGKGVIRGFGSKLFDARTWDMGYTDLKGGLSLAEVLKKADEGKPLTVEQQKMLDAKATELACAAYFSGALGRGYKAGQVTAESIPFMLEFMLNPLSGTGRSAQAMLTRYALKRFGRKATMELGEDAAKKILYGDIRQLTKSVFDKGLSKGARRLAAKTLAGKASARIAGDITGAAGMTFTTGQGRVVADMLNRATGQVKFGVDTDGKVKYTGHDAPEESSLLTAYGKAFGSQFSENYSEFMGPYISYVGGMFANGLKKIGGKYLFDGLSSLRNRSAAAVMKLPFAPMVSDFIREATKSDWAKVIKGMQKRAHWDGTAEEYLEEVAGNMLNAILVGDNDFSTEEGRGVFNLSDNIDTFLGVGLMSGAMSVASAAGYRTPAYRARKMVENADSRGEKLLGSSLWGKFKSSFDAAQSEQDKQVILTSLLQNSSLTNEGRRAVLQYASGKQFQQAVADGTFREMEEDAEKGNEVERACRAEYAEGQNIDNVEEMRDAKTRYNVLLREALAVEPNAEMYSDPQFYEQSNPNATPEQKAAMRAYAEAKAQYEGVADRMKTDMADQQQKANEQVERFKNQTDGLITRVRLRGSDAEFYVTSGHISLNNDGTINDAATSSNLTIVDGEGNQRFISRGDVVDVLAQNTPEETLEQLNDIIMNEAKAKADLIDGKLSFRAGDTFTILNNEGQEQKVTIAQDPSTMAMSAVIEGEQAAVPLTEDSMAKLQQMSDAYQESRFGKYRQEQQDAVANAENEATQEEATPASPTASQEEAGAPTEGRSYGYGESVSYVDGEGHTQEGVVHGKTPEGTYEVEFDNPPSGKEVVDEYTQEELDALVQPSSAEQTEEVVPEQVPEEEPAEPQGNDAADSVPPTTEELVEMARRGNELAQYQLDQQGIQWKEPAEQTKDNAVAQSPKKDVPRDKDGNIIYDQVPVATTIEDLYDGALDDEEIGNFVQSQIDAAKKAVDKITKKKPQISTNKSAYLEAKKKWEGELREAERKAQYWNDVKAEVEKITTPADARGWKDELSGEAARRQYRENSGNDHEAKSASEVAAEFFSQSHVKVTPESYRKETGFGLDEQRKMVGKISKEGKTIDRLSEELALFDEEYYNGRFFGGDSMVAKDALIAHLSSADARKGVSKVQSEAEAQFVEDYEEQRERYYQERYHMSYEEYIEYSAQEMPELMRKYSNFDEQQFYNRYADEIEADLTRREQQSNNNNGTEENDSTREEQRHDRGNQVQSGQRTDDNSGSEGGEDSEGAVRTRDEGSDEQKSSSEESAVGGQREQETDIEQVEGANEVDKSSHKTDNQGNPLNADGTLKLEKVKSVDDLTDEDFSKPTRSVELPQVPENVDNALGADGKPVIIKKNIFEKNWEAHKFPFAESRSILKSALYNTDLVGQTQPTKRPLHWVAIKLDEKSPIVVLEVNENKDNVEIVGWYTLDGRNLERIKRQAEKNGGELVMLSPKDKVESLSTPQSDLSSDGKGKEKVSSKQGSVGRKNVYGKNKVADWRTSVSSAMRQYETSPHDAHVAMCDIIDGMDSNALYGLMRMVLRTITSLDNENIRDGWKVDATHDLFDILKDRGFVVTKGSKGVAIGDVVIDKHGIIYVVEGVGKSRLDCGLSDVNDKTIIDHMTISRASVKYYYRDVNGKKDSVRLQKADVVDAELMAEEKPFNAVIEMLRKKFPDASMEALTAADRLLREQALPGERQKAIEAVAKALGLKVEWRDTMEKENGTFNPKTRTITIARDSEHALANTFGHEVTHAVRNLSEADYKNLKDAVRRLYSSEKEYNEAVQAYGDEYTGLDFDALEEELIADNIGFMIGGRNDMTQELASRMNHRVLWAIHDAMNKVRNALAKVLHIDSKKNGLLETIDSARATIRETMANTKRIAKEKGQGLSNESGSARQSLRTQDTAIRDALVEHMRLSFKDMVADEEGQRVLDMANGRDTRFEAARHKSEAARRRDEMLRAIDQAKAFISGKTEQQTRAERRERERKFREETKVLYDRVLAGNFDSVTLQLLDDFINKVTPNNYYGRPLSKRLSERTLRKVHERERTSSVDALFSRISESAVPADERTRPEAKRRIEEKKKELLKGWAIATGNWHTAVSDFTDDTKPIGSGKDSVVYHSKDGKSVIKVSKGKESARKFRPDMDNIALFNTVFPASKYEIIGYGEIDGKFVRFLRQPIVDFTDSTPLSVEERVAYMERLGFRPMNDEKTAFTNGEIVASDIQGNNIVRDRDGNIRVIDADMRFHTKEFGGKYSYPAVETDTETAPNIREQRVYHGSGADFKHFDHSHMGEGQGTQSFGWGTYVTSSKAIGKTYSESGRKKPTYLYGRFKMSPDEFHDYVLSAIVGYSNEDMLNDFMYNLERYGVTRAKDILKKGDLAQYKNLFYQSIGDTRNNAEWKIKAAQTLLSLKGIRIKKPKIHLYTVEIPEDNGSNYLDWKAKVGVGLLNKVNSQLEQQGKRPINPNIAKRYEFLSGEDLYETLSMRMAKDDATFNDDKAASEFLSSLGFVGIKYPAGTIHGGAKEGDTNYVIFNEKDAKITDHVRFFRTANGEAYGFTVGGKIYIDPRIATAETPIHEYAHLWATALKSANAKEWQNVVGLMKGTKVWDEVKALYPELKSDDEIADEVLATYSGRRGAERLREEQRRIAKGNGSVFEKAEAISALERVKQALKRFWKGVADFLHIHYTSAEEVADRVMKDLLDGVDPRKFGDGGKSLDAYNKIRKHFIGEQGAERADHAEEVTTRIDNLNVAREMEDAKKNAKAIKMATGWERGADGKWRYEIPDLKYFGKGDAGYKKARGKQPWSKELDGLSDKIFDGEELSESEYRRFDELAQKEDDFKTDYLNREKPHLADWVENDELFKAYPDLKRVNVVFTDQLPTNVGGSYNEREHTIVVNTNYVGDTDSVLAHEVQHAIQKIEGFAKGGNPETIRQRIEDYVGKNEEEAENTKSIIKSAFDLFGKASKLETIYPIMINSDVEWQRQTATDAYWDALNTIDNGFRHFETEVKNDYSQFKGMSPYEIARTGYHVKETIEELKRMSDEYLNSLTDDDRYLEELVDRYKKALESDSDAVLYTRLSGEVESRNVERRMGMSAEERRASLAAETEDVSREDQIFLFGEGGSYDTAVVVAKREAQTKPSAGHREAEPKTLKGKEALAALDNIFRENAASVMPETVSSLERFKDLFRRPIRTFLGELVKVKDEVWNKILRNNRQDITGTVLPTIENADFAIRDTDGSTLYVKRFESERSGNLYNIVVVNKHGEVEDYVSSVHIKRDGNLRNKIKNGAELFLPQERNTDGTLFRNNSTPAAKVVKTDGLSQQSNEKKQSRRGTPNLYPDHIAQAIYEQSVNGFKFDLDEAWHDSLLSVKRLQEAISETRGVPIRDFENVYWHAVTLSSVNAAEMEQLMNLRIQPFIEAVQDICKKHDLTQEDIEVYLNCKHGLERNEAMARRDAEKQANEEFKDELRKAERAAAKDPLDQDAADALDDVKQRMNDREEELYLKNREKDYSGLTDIFDPKDKVTGDRLDLTVAELEDEAKKYVKRFEAEVGVADVTKLWDNIHELNNYSLRKSYLCGLISKSQYDSVKQMYQWYVPLRGFNEEVAGDVYTYVTRGETRTQQHPKRKHPPLAKTRVNPLPNRRRIMP